MISSHTPKSSSTFSECCGGNVTKRKENGRRGSGKMRDERLVKLELGGQVTGHTLH